EQIVAACRVQQRAKDRDAGVELVQSMARRSRRPLHVEIDEVQMAGRIDDLVRAPSISEHDSGAVRGRELEQQTQNDFRSPGVLELFCQRPSLLKSGDNPVLA